MQKRATQQPGCKMFGEVTYLILSERYTLLYAYCKSCISFVKKVWIPPQSVELTEYYQFSESNNTQYLEE